MNLRSEYENSKVLVTGASGFIGSSLTGSLVQLGANVTGTYRSNCPEEPALGSGLEYVQADLADLNQAADLLQKTMPTHIFHLAGNTNGDRSDSSIIPTLTDNLIGTVNLLAAANKAGCRQIIIAGSQEEPEPAPTQLVPSSPYAASKYAATSYARSFHALYGLPVSIARIFMVYGPGQHDRSKLIPYVIDCALRDSAPQLSSGKRKVDWVYIDDLVHGLLILGAQPNSGGCTVEFGSGEFHSVREVVNRIIDRIDPAIEPLFGQIPDRPLEQERRAQINESFNQLGWRPTTTLDKGLENTIRWFKENR